MSGSQIGGVVGYAAGAIVGSFVPGLGTAVGGQLGYALGSAIGGYIDPTQVKGPRITDAAGQTSNVGVPLPFGYGIFPTAGNVIWADELKEQVKRQRQGKGGGTKTTTYTYTRSYAIGICEGPIYGYVQIKRNGKLVYTSDPNAPVADKDYSAKWLQKVTLYYGDEEQMPDSTIEAVVGAGNVAAFRGLAYIVVENDDLTDLAGAIPQYEFVVNATQPDLYITSQPYPILNTESAYLSAAPQSGMLRELVDLYEYRESANIRATPVAGLLRNPVLEYMYGESANLSASAQSGVLRSLKVEYMYGESASMSASPLSGSLATKLVSTTDRSLSAQLSASPVEGTLQ